jgi:hypothetical protein
MLECPVDTVVKAKRKKMLDKVRETDRARERESVCVCVYLRERERGDKEKHIDI